MKKLPTFLFLLTSLFFLDSAFALDSRDEGTYFVISNKDGKVTDKAIKLLKEGNDWKLKDRLDSGKWSDSTCKGDCRLKESDKGDIFRFFSIAPNRDQIEAPSCVHNVAFAFCRFNARNDKVSRYYVFIVLMGKFVPSGLVRLVRAEENKP